MLEKYIVCDTCGLKPPSVEPSIVLYYHITPTYTSSIQELIMQGMQQKLEKSCFRCKKNTWHVESSYILQPPKYLIIVVNVFRYINNNFTKDRCSIPMDMTLVLGLHKFSLHATIDHHGPSIFWPLYYYQLLQKTHYQLLQKAHYCNDSKITEFEMIGIKKLLYCFCGNLYIDFVMFFLFFFLTRTGGDMVLTTPVALAHPLHPIRSRSRNKRRNLWVGWCVSSWRPWFWPVYSIDYIHTIHYSCNLSN